MQAWRLGSYEVIRRLGEGGMAQIYLARDVRLGREVAVKVLDQRLAERPGFRDRFLREARVVASLDHPNIVPLYDFGDSEQMLYLVMPYVSGGSLQDMLKRTPLPVGEVVTYGAQIADALDYAHQRNVVHRDVKPANMLVHADGRLQLSDFGLAKILGNTARPAAPRGHPDAGTPEYMAPEQIEGRTDERSDLYALGVVLYLLLTGHLPFTGSTSKAVMEGHLYRLPEQPRLLNPAVTPAMQAVVLRALAKHPDDRYQRASEMGAALLGALIAGDAEPLPFALGSAEPPVSLPPITPRAPSTAPQSFGGTWPSSRSSHGSYNSGAIGDTLPHAVPAAPVGTPLQQRLSHGPAMSPSPSSTLGRMAITGRSSQGSTSAPWQRDSLVPEAPVSALPFSRTEAPAPVPMPGTRSASSTMPESGQFRSLWIMVAVVLLLALIAAGLLLRWLQDQPTGGISSAFTHLAALAGSHHLLLVSGPSGR